jgi:hypothetical protein
VSVKATTWAWEHSKASGNARLVLLAIADAADQQGANAWPSQATIASMCRISVRTVRRLVAELVELGELEVTEHGGPAYREDRRPHRYRLCKMPDGTGGHPDLPALPPRENGRTREANGRTNPVERADTGVPITSFLDPPSRTTTPSGGTADAVVVDVEQEAPEMPGPKAPEQPGLFEVAEVREERAGKTPAQEVVSAFVDSHRRQHGADPTRSEIGRVARDTKRLIGNPYTPEQLITAATAMGKTAFANISMQLKITTRGSATGKGIARAHPHGEAEWKDGASVVANEVAELLRSDPGAASWFSGQAAASA